MRRPNFSLQISDKWQHCEISYRKTRKNCKNILGEFTLTHISTEIFAKSHNQLIKTDYLLVFATLHAYVSYLFNLIECLFFLAKIWKSLIQTLIQLYTHLNLKESRARICKPFKEPRNRFTGLASRYDNPIWRTSPPGYIVHRLAKSISWNRFLGSLKVHKFGLWLAIPVLNGVANFI